MTTIELLSAAAAALFLLTGNTGLYGVSPVRQDGHHFGKKRRQKMTKIVVCASVMFVLRFEEG
jgi:hypothetical protein